MPIEGKTNYQQVSIGFIIHSGQLIVCHHWIKIMKGKD